jgi:hypothetical protein
MRDMFQGMTIRQRSLGFRLGYCLVMDGSILVVGQERSALLVGRGSASSRLASAKSGNGDHDSRDEQDGHDGKGEDPLEGNDLAEELRDTDGGGEDAEREPDGVVLVKSVQSFNDELGGEHTL